MALQNDMSCILYGALWGWSFENYNPSFFPLKKCMWIFEILKGPACLHGSVGPRIGEKPRLIQFSSFLIVFKLKEPTVSGRRQCPEVKVPRHLGQPSHLGADFVLTILTSPVKRKFYLYVCRNFEFFFTIIVLLTGMQGKHSYKFGSVRSSMRYAGAFTYGH